MGDLLNGQIVEVLKWIGIVLAAGFIGYFGRYLAMALIERARRKGGSKAAAAEPAEKKDFVQDTREEGNLKAEKKRAKSEVKLAKKKGKN